MDKLIRQVRNSIATVNLSRDLANETKVLISELEVGRMVTPTTLVAERLHGLQFEQDSPMLQRQKLFEVYFELEQMVRPPQQYEQAVIEFEQTVSEALEELQSKSLNSCFKVLDVCLKVLVSVQYFTRTATGMAETDKASGSKTFREAVNRLVIPRQLPAASDESSMMINEIVQSFSKAVKTAKTIDEFTEMFDAQAVLDCAKQLLVEIQERLYGPPTLCVNRVDAALLAALAKVEGFADFRAIRNKSITIAPTPARELTRATKALNAAAGKDPLNSIRKASKPPAEDEVEEKEDFPPPPRKAIVPANITQDDASNETEDSDDEDELDTQIFPKQTPPKNTRKATPQSGASDSSLKKKRRNPFTGAEDDALRAGVAKHGEGMWKEILTDLEFSETFELNMRTNVSLKDRWRNLNKQ